MFSVAFTEAIHAQFVEHLIRSDRQEDLCFALYWPSQGRDRQTALIGAIVLPGSGDRAVHGNASFTSGYFLRALEMAEQRGAGLALAHSHPLGSGWQGMSTDDVSAELSHAAQALAVTGLPLVGVTLGGHGNWSCREWVRVSRGEYQRVDGESVRVVGERLALAHNPSLRPVPALDGRLHRTVSAWGPETQAGLGRLRVGVIGVGSVGSLVAESLARTGIGEIRLIDFDTVELGNLDRLLHASRVDVALARSKVEVLAEALRRSATSRPFRAEPLELSICEEDGFRAALDCDVLFCCVDRPWPRFVLNVIAYAHLIPVVDGGVHVEARKDPVRLVSADWRAYVAGPGRRCLECAGQYSPGLVDTDRRGDFDNPHYIAALADDHPARHGENVFAFSAACASLEVLQALIMLVAPCGVGDIGGQHYHLLPGTVDIEGPACRPTCPFSESLLGLGDSYPAHCTGEHEVAQAQIARRQTARRTARVRLGRALVGLLRRLGAVVEKWLLGADQDLIERPVEGGDTHGTSTRRT